MTPFEEQLHVERKARLVRMGAIPDPVHALREAHARVVSKLTARIHELESLVRDREEKLTSLRKTLIDHRSLTPQPVACFVPTVGATLPDIMRTVCDFYAVNHAQIISSQKDASITLPRHVLFFLANKAGMTLNQIGRAVGGRDHSSVHSGIKKIANRAETEPLLRQAITEIAMRAEMRCKDRLSKEEGEQ